MIKNIFIDELVEMLKSSQRFRFEFYDHDNYKNIISDHVFKGKVNVEFVNFGKDKTENDNDKEHLLFVQYTENRKAAYCINLELEGLDYIELDGGDEGDAERIAIINVFYDDESSFTIFVKL